MPLEGGSADDAMPALLKGRMHVGSSLLTTVSEGRELNDSVQCLQRHKCHFTFTYLAPPSLSYIHLSVCVCASVSLCLCLSVSLRHCSFSSENSFFLLVHRQIHSHARELVSV